MNQPERLIANGEVQSRLGETCDNELSEAGGGISRRRALQVSGLAAVGAIAKAVTAKTAQADPGPGKIGEIAGRRSTGDSIYKQRAIRDYQHNMVPFGGRMSANPDRLLQSFPRGVPWQFDVLVVGSGYGASISAARLAARLKPGYRLAIGWQYSNVAKNGRLVPFPIDCPSCSTATTAN